MGKPAKKSKAPPSPAEVEYWKELLEVAAAFLAMSTSGPNSKGMSKPPSRRRLGRVAQLLLHQPQLRAHPAAAPFLDAILEQYVAANEPETIGPAAIGLAFEMGTYGKNGVPPRQARRCIVTALNMRPETVRQALHAARKDGRREGAEIIITDALPGLHQEAEEVAEDLGVTSASAGERQEPGPEDFSVILRQKSEVKF